MQQWASMHGYSAVQAQMMGVMAAYQQVVTAAAVMAFDDVFRVTAAVTLLALIPAAFMRTPKTTGPRPRIISE